MCAITAGGPWEGRKHPPRNRTAGSTTAPDQVTEPCLSGPDCRAYNSIFPVAFFAPHIHVIKAPLPDAIRAMQMHRGRRGEGSQHSHTPRQLAFRLEIFENELGRLLLEALDDSGGVGSLRRPDQGMEGFGPQNLPDDLEAQLGPQYGEHGDALPVIPVGIKPPGSAVSAGSDKMQVVQPAMMPLARHAGIVAQGPAHMAQYAMYAPPAVGAAAADWELVADKPSAAIGEGRRAAGQRRPLLLAAAGRE
jgi:hypothetical protein